MNLLAKGLECIHERRLPYAVERRLYAPSILPLHRRLIDRYLKRAEVQPKYISLDEARCLQSQFPCRDGYKYDLASKKARAVERLERIRRAAPLDRPLQVLEIGGGDGHLSLLFAQHGHRCTLLDIEDWRDGEVRDSPVQFIGANASQRFPFDAMTFDLCVSFNTMEHVPDPTTTFHEVLRVLRPGGTAYLQFDPLFNSAWGLHAYRLVHFPFPQFLLSPQDFAAFVAHRRTNDDLGDRQDIPFVNRWSAASFRRLLTVSKEVGTCDLTVQKDITQIPFIYRYRHALSGHRLDVEELISSGIEATVHKRADWDGHAGGGR